MAYVALYRKWRPQDFDNLVGQDHVGKTLKNAIITGRIAHAYLFSGPRGTGKTSTAKILAKALNCVEGPIPNPCNKCSNCQKITQGISMDVFEIDAASNRGIDEIRDLREKVKFTPVDGRYKVYIIDEVHMLTTEAFNALLKTLEEPPGHVVFVLATTEPHKIPATIHSRCQRFDFRRIAVKDIEERLGEVIRSTGLSIEAEALRLIAVHADGGLRDALSILDQCATLGGETISAGQVRSLLGLIGYEWIFNITDAFAEKDVLKVLNLFDELISLGKDIRQVLLELAQHIRNLMLFKAAPQLETFDIYSENKKILEEQSKRFSHQELVNIIAALHSAANELKWSPEPRVTAEMSLLSICEREVGEDILSLAKRVKMLEEKLSQPLAVPIKVSAPNVCPEVKVAAKEEKTPIKPAIKSGDIKSIWDGVLKELMAGGKRSVHACVAQGTLTALEGNVATVTFSARFPKERTEKDDYRDILEKVFAQLTGNHVKLNCVLGATVNAVPEQNKKTKPEDYAALEQAKKMFGGKVLKLED